MGAWSHNTFDNDDASDWVYELEESSDMSVIENALNEVTDDAEDYIEAPECSNAIAAAEVVAALNGNESANLPESVQAWVAGKPEPDVQINAKAHAAIAAILANSELKDLWEENAEDYPKWIACIDEIRTRIPNAG